MRTSSCSIYGSSKIMLGHSTRNHKFKRLQPHFQFLRRGRDEGRSRKLLSIYHTHESAPRSPYLPCQIVDRWKNSELEQNHGISYRKKMGGSGASSCRFDQRFVFFKWQVASPTKKTILRTNPQLETPLPLYFSCTTFRIATTPATPSIHKCTTWRWTIRCSHYRL